MMAKKDKGNNNHKHGLTMRELNIGDAYYYWKIATPDQALHTYTSFFEARSLDEARRRIRKFSTKYETLYGLFNESHKLVAVFDVSDDVFGNTATVSYFVGAQYRGKNYAYRGLILLKELLANSYSLFSFEIRKTNLASLGVQKKLGSQKIYVSEDYIQWACDVP